MEDGQLTAAAAGCDAGPGSGASSGAGYADSLAGAGVRENVLFATSGQKPEIVLRDAISNVIENYRGTCSTALSMTGH
jgi:hypothetical protein